jgi:hypothetical protein
MRTFFRYLLWILIAALPLQGSIAAVVSCQPGAPPLAAVRHMDASAAPDHCQQADDAKAAGHGKCSHCASCCVGAAAPPMVPALVLPAALSSFAGNVAEPAMTAYIPATLERPPRRLS